MPSLGSDPMRSTIADTPDGRLLLGDFPVSRPPGITGSEIWPNRLALPSGSGHILAAPDNVLRVLPFRLVSHSVFLGITTEAKYAAAWRNWLIVVFITWSQCWMPC